MAVLSASAVVSTAPACFQNEVSPQGAGCADGLSCRAGPCSASLRRNTNDTLKKSSVHATCQRLNRLSRGKLTSRGWWLGCQYAFVAGVFLIVLAVLARLVVRARQAEPPTLRSVPVQVAHELINAGHHCLDVRTQEEYSAGHVEGAVNIPYLVKAGPGMSKNLKFLEQVEAMFSKDDEIVVGCQSGRRSMMAAAELRAASFTGVTDMGGGYLAWKESGLPVKFPQA